MSTSSIQTLSARIANADNAYTYIARQPIAVRWLHVTYTATATVGNRLLTMTVKNAAGEAMYDIRAGAVQAASQIRHYSFQPGVYREAAFVNNEIQVAIPEGILEAGWSLTIEDENNVDAADTFVLAFQGDL